MSVCKCKINYCKCIGMFAKVGEWTLNYVNVAKVCESCESMRMYANVSECWMYKNVEKCL
jgi:hypothetical protein